MKLLVKLNMDNEAFADGAFPAEAARILRKLAATILSEDARFENCNLRDINGNKVGTAVLETEED